MRFVRGKPTHTDGEHQVKVLQFDDEAEAAFVAICSCGRASPPYRTRKEALRWANDHSPNVSEEVEVLHEEGGTGWRCLFCGSVIERAPLRVSVHWTDDGVDGEQWYASHRECLVQRMSDAEELAPRFVG